MKKILVIITIVVMISIFSFKKQESLESVFDYNEEDNLVLNIYIPNLDTNNFKNYFDNEIEIIGIYPKINMIYKNKLGNLFYLFTGNNLEENINNFTKYYKGVLKKNNFSNDLILSDYNGIKIEKVKVITTSFILNKMLERCNNCSYEKTQLS